MPPRTLFLCLVCLVLLAAAVPERASARPSGSAPPPVVHEPIPPDAREDLAMHIALEGDLPAALLTPSGLVSAPDPRQLPSASEPSYGGAGSASFTPDRNTGRPDVSGYDDPFTPSTAPFKRLEVFDAVRPDYQLYVRDARLTPVAINSVVGVDDDAFYADVVVNASPDGLARIPSVGPGARIVRARLGVGDEDVAFRVVHDGADNWFLQTPAVRGTTRARLVMEVAIARGSFGGQWADRPWGDLPLVAPLPDNVARDAALVRSAIGVSRQMAPREAISRLVQYFRAFSDSPEAPRGQGNVYLDLALSKKGVCRHRAFAFLVTAQSLGIPTRMVLNEAHAWVEVHDGTLWRRIDLGGAGRMQVSASAPPSALPERAIHRPPPDSFAWPQNAERGDDMIAVARSQAASGGPGAAASDSAGTDGDSAARGKDGRSDPGAARETSTTGAPGTPGPASDGDSRPVPVISLRVAEAEARRGLPLHVRGEVRADGEPCAHVAVDLWLRDGSARPARAILLGTMATGDDGAFGDGIVVPARTPLGDYDIVARSHGDAQCADGESR
jgi:transglutaminase-like putative cysteine protease